MKKEMKYFCLISWVSVMLLTIIGAVFIGADLTFGMAFIIGLLIVSLAAGIVVWSAIYVENKCKKLDESVKHDLMTCPHCGSIDADYLSSDTDCEYPEWTYKCRECGVKWTEYAELKYVGYNINEEENH